MDKKNVSVLKMCHPFIVNCEKAISFLFIQSVQNTPIWHTILVVVVIFEYLNYFLCQRSVLCAANGCQYQSIIWTTMIINISCTNNMVWFELSLVCASVSICALQTNTYNAKSCKITHFWNQSIRKQQYKSLICQKMRHEAHFNGGLFLLRIFVYLYSTYSHVMSVPCIYTGARHCKWNLFLIEKIDIRDGLIVSSYFFLYQNYRQF